MTTRIKTISLNMRKAYAKVQAAEEKCKSVEQAVNRTKIYCYAVTDKLNILTEESKKRTRYVWESQNKNTEFSLVVAMWHAGEEAEEAQEGRSGPRAHHATQRRSVHPANVGGH